jgi:asparagine synthase (glutamine-hydrolysing)
MDIASMANSLEVRAPFLDHKLVEFAASIPSQLKRNQDGGKLILKRAVRKLLPSEILNRPKSGFGVPLARWLRHDLSETLRILDDDRARRRGLFHRPALLSMIDQHQQGKRDWSNRLWALIMLELWFREFIDRS